MLILQSTVGDIQTLAFSADAGTLYTSHGGAGVWIWYLAQRVAAQVVFGDELLIQPFVPLPGGRWAVGQALTKQLRNNPNRLIDLTADKSRPFLLFPELGVAVCDGYLVGVGNSYYDEKRPSATPTLRVYGFALTGDGPQYAWHVNVPVATFVSAAVRLGPTRFATWERMTVHTARGSELRQYATARRAEDGVTEYALELPLPTSRFMQQVLASPDGSQLVVRYGTDLRVWNGSRWVPAEKAGGKYKPSMTGPAAAFHPSGRYLLMANDGPSVLVYDTATWKQVRKWKWDVGVLRVLAISPDGSLAAAAGPRGRIVVWDLDL